MIIFLFSLGVFAIDQLIKFLVYRFAPYYTVLGANTLIFGNIGATVVSFIFVILLLGLILRDKKIILANLWTSLASGFCLGGAISNIIDRLWRGGVLDIGQGRLRTNLADILVFVGLFMLFYFYFSRKNIES